MIRESSGPGLLGSPSSAVAQGAAEDLLLTNLGPPVAQGDLGDLHRSGEGPIELAHLWTHQKVRPGYKDNPKLRLRGAPGKLNC